MNNQVKLIEYLRNSSINFHKVRKFRNDLNKLIKI